MLEPTNYETDYSSNGICVSTFIFGYLPVARRDTDSRLLVLYCVFIDEFQCRTFQYLLFLVF